MAGKIIDRLDALARRCGDLSPIAGDVRRIVTDGNREMFLSGREDTGAAVRPLAPSTLKKPRGGPRGVPHGANSRAVADLVVGVQAGPGRLAVSKSWPNFPAVHFLGRSLGYRAEDLDEIRKRLAAYVMRGDKV